MGYYSSEIYNKKFKFDEENLKQKEILGNQLLMKNSLEFDINYDDINEEYYIKKASKMNKEDQIDYYEETILRIMKLNDNYKNYLTAKHDLEYFEQSFSNTIEATLKNSYDEKDSLILERNVIKTKIELEKNIKSLPRLITIESTLRPYILEMAKELLKKPRVLDSETKILIKEYLSRLSKKTNTFDIESADIALNLVSLIDENVYYLNFKNQRKTLIKNPNKKTIY